MLNYIWLNKSLIYDILLFVFVQIKKCLKPECNYCSKHPPRMSDFENVSFLPDAVISDGVYKDFEALYGTETTDSCRPSLKSTPHPTEKDKEHKNILNGGGFLVVGSFLGL